MVDSTVTFSAVTSAAEAACGRAASTNNIKAKNRFIEIPSNLWRDHGGLSAIALGSGENVSGGGHGHAALSLSRTSVLGDDLLDQLYRVLLRHHVGAKSRGWENARRQSPSRQPSRNLCFVARRRPPGVRRACPVSRRAHSASACADVLHGHRA